MLLGEKRRNSGQEPYRLANGLASSRQRRRITPSWDKSKLVDTVSQRHIGYEVVRVVKWVEGF